MSADHLDENGTDYEVGYRRPPLHTRFQPDRSGNPSGRPKGSPNLKQVLKEQISLREEFEDKPEKINRIELVVLDPLPQSDPGLDAA